MLSRCGRRIAGQMTVSIGLVYLTVSQPVLGTDLPEFPPDRPAPMEIVIPESFTHS